METEKPDMAIIDVRQIKTKEEVLDCLEITLIQEIDFEPETSEDISYQKGIEFCLNLVRELNGTAK